MSTLLGAALKIKQLATPGNPAAGTSSLYPKADGKWYTKDPAGTETLVGPTVTVAGQSGTAPVGTIAAFGGTAAPVGWLLCDGAVYSVSAYPVLGALLGATFGGDGTTTFAVPDLRSRTAIGVGQGAGLSNRARGAKGGEEAHLLTTTEMPSHSHTGTSGNDAPDHGHHGDTSGFSTNHTHGATDAQGSHAHSTGIQNLGTRGSGTQNTIVSGGAIGTSTDGAHGHNTGWADRDHSHSFDSWGANARHAHSITAEGGGGTHENMPPFLALAYVIKAVAGGDDLTGGAAPVGPAGGDLTGSYPNPAIGVGKVTSAHILDGTIVDTDVAAANKDGAVGVPSLRTLGTGALQAAAGNDARFTDSRAPNGAAGGDLAGTYPNPTIGVGKVTSAAIADGTIQAADIAAGVLYPDTQMLAPVRLATGILSNVTPSGNLSIDGVTTAPGDRVLLTGQTTKTDNGIWVAAAGAWTRATDADTAAKAPIGMRTRVLEGSGFKGRTYTQLSSTPGDANGQQWYVATSINTGGSFFMPVATTNGQLAFNSNQNAIGVWDGSNWQYAGQPQICTSTTRPGFVTDRSVIYETDTGLSYIWSNNTWRLFGDTKMLAPVRVVEWLNNLSLSGTPSIDGVTVAVGDRVLAKAQSTKSEVGIWVVAAGAWTRAADADAAVEYGRGVQVRVLEGAQMRMKTFTQLSLTPDDANGQQWRVHTTVDDVNWLTYPTPQGIGHMVYDSTNRNIAVWDSWAAKWAQVGYPEVVTSTTRPSTPTEGKTIFESDTGLAYIYQASTWKPLGGGGGGTAEVNVSTGGPSPRVGQLLWVDTDEPSVGDPSRVAWGQLAYTEITANVANSGQLVIPGLTATLTAPGNRRWRISAFVSESHSAAGAWTAIHLLQDGTVIESAQGMLSNNTATTFMPTRILTPAAGSHTYTVRADLNTPSATINATTVAPLWLLIEDIGPG